MTIEVAGYQSIGTMPDITEAPAMALDATGEHVFLLDDDPETALMSPVFIGRLRTGLRKRVPQGARFEDLTEEQQELYFSLTSLDNPTPSVVAAADVVLSAQLLREAKAERAAQNDNTPGVDPVAVDMHNFREARRTLLILQHVGDTAAISTVQQYIDDLRARIPADPQA